MHKRAYYSMVARPGYRAIRLPYAVNDLNMVVVLPDAVDGLADARLGTEEAAELFGALLRNGQTRYVDLSLPRFKTAFKAELVTPLRRECPCHSTRTGRISAASPAARCRRSGW